MEFIPKDPMLKFQPDAMEGVRRIYDLDGPGRMEEAIKILKEWCQKQNHFTKKDFNTSYLEKTLIACKGSIEKSKNQIDKMCTLRTLLPNFFINCHVKKDLKSITDIAWLLALPRMTKDYYRVFLIKINDKEFTSESFMEYCRLNVVICEYLKQHDYANGYIIIQDYRDLNLLEVMRKLSITEVQEFLTILVEGFGARMLGFNILSPSKTVDMFLKFLKQFLSAKMAGRIFVHATLESIHGIIDKEILPEEYGGSERSVYKLQEDWIDVLSSDEHVEYMEMMNKACTNEAYRQTDKFNEQYMGTPGTFRSLNFD